MSTTTSVTQNTTTNIKAALIDLSGTLHVGETPIPGALEAMQRLKEANISTLFLTNTTKVSSQTLYQQLQTMGFTTIRDSDIMTSTLACQTFLKQYKLRPFCLLDSAIDDLQGHVPLTPPHDCVVVGLAPNTLDYTHLNQAFQILQQTTVKHPLIAIHRGLYYRDDEHQLSLGPGGFVSCLEQASNTQALVIGKPNSAFYQAALQQVGMSDAPQQVCMVGDDVLSDVCGAHEAGVGHTILVQTGKYQERDDTKAPFNAIIVPSIVEAVDYILQHKA